MRPVSKDRRSPKPRGVSGRTPSRGVTRGTAQSASGKRGNTGDGIFRRVLGFVGGLINFRHPILLVALGVIIISLVAAVTAGHLIDRTVTKTNAAAGAIASDSGFGVAQLHLTGNARTTPSQILAALDLKGGQSIFGFNLRQARARLLALPWVADAEVKRRYPDDISVRIVERVPFARWQNGSGLFVVEPQGRVIEAVGSDKFVRLPLLLGDGAPDNAPKILAAVARHRSIVSRVQGYQYQSHRRWNLLLDDGVVVKLPENGFDKQLDALDKLIVEKGILESDIREIDMRDPSYLYFVRRNGAEQQKDRKTESGSAI